MLEALQWTDLQRKKRAKVIMLYRIVNHLVAISPEPYLIPRGVALTTRGHDTRFLLPYSSHQQSFFPSAIRLWNELPTAVVTASTSDNLNISRYSIYHLQSVHCHIYVWLKFWSLTVTEVKNFEALKEYSS